MREKLNHPYFVAYIANVDDKDNWIIKIFIKTNIFNSF